MRPEGPKVGDRTAKPRPEMTIKATIVAKSPNRRARRSQDSPDLRAERLNAEAREHRRSQRRQEEGSSRHAEPIHSWQDFEEHREQAELPPGGEDQARCDQDQPPANRSAIGRPGHRDHRQGQRDQADRGDGLPVVVVPEVVGRPAQRPRTEKLKGVNRIEVIPARQLERESGPSKTPLLRHSVRDQLDPDQPDRQGQDSCPGEAEGPRLAPLIRLDGGEGIPRRPAPKGNDQVIALLRVPGEECRGQDRGQGQEGGPTAFHVGDFSDSLSLQERAGVRGVTGRVTSVQFLLAIHPRCDAPHPRPLSRRERGGRETPEPDCRVEGPGVPAGRPDVRIMSLERLGQDVRRRLDTPRRDQASPAAHPERPGQPIRSDPRPEQVGDRDPAEARRGTGPPGEPGRRIEQAGLRVADERPAAEAAIVPARDVPEPGERPCDAPGDGAGTAGSGRCRPWVRRTVGRGRRSDGRRRRSGRRDRPRADEAGQQQGREDDPDAEVSPTS